MNVILLLICMATLAFAEVHPGLKNAIDNGDYKTAKNLKQKMHVEGTYLPPSLSIKDAEFIYGPITNYKWLLDIDGFGCSSYSNNECSPEFIDKYLVKVCSGTTEYDVEVCLAWLNATPPTEWTRYANYFCKNKKSIKTCSLYVEKQPLEKQYEILNELDKKNLVEFEQTMEIDTVVKEKLSKKQCLDNWKQVYSVVKASIEYDSQKGEPWNHISRGYLQESIICFFDGSRKKQQQCLGYLDEFSKGMKKECNSGKIEIDVQKKIKVKRPYKPFDNVLSQLRKKIDSLSWYEWDDKSVELLNFLRKYEGNGEIKETENLINQYSKFANISISDAKRACLLYPKVDKTISEKTGIYIFSFIWILKDFPAYLDSGCDAKEYSWIKKIPLLLMDAKDSMLLVCDKNTKKYRVTDEFETLSGQLCENPDSSWMKTYYWDKESYYKKDSTTLVCDRKIGKFRKATEIEAYLKKLCENPEKSWLDTTSQVVCDKKLGEFRIATDVEKYTRGLCESPEFSWIDESKQIVCDKKIGWRYANQFEKIGGLCESPKSSWMDESKQVVCDKKIGGFREPDKFEIISKELCDSPEKSWIKQYNVGERNKEEYIFVCEKNADRFREASIAEKFGGLCTDGNQKKGDSYAYVQGKLLDTYKDY